MVKESHGVLPRPRPRPAAVRLPSGRPRARAGRPAGWDEARPAGPWPVARSGTGSGRPRPAAATAPAPGLSGRGRPAGRGRRSPRPRPGARAGPWLRSRRRSRTSTARSSARSSAVAASMYRCRKPAPPGQMLCGTPSARSRERCLAGRSWFGRTCDDLRLVGLKLIFLDRHPCRVGAGLVAAGGVVEGRRDPDAAPSARCGPARAASGSFAVDVAGPGVAGAARRDAAGRAPGRDAADRHPGHDLALAPRHRPPPVGAAVAPGPFRPAAGAP